MSEDSLYRYIVTLDYADGVSCSKTHLNGASKGISRTLAGIAGCIKIMTKTMEEGKRVMIAVEIHKTGATGYAPEEQH